MIDTKITQFFKH